LIHVLYDNQYNYTFVHIFEEDAYTMRSVVLELIISDLSAGEG